MESGSGYRGMGKLSGDEVGKEGEWSNFVAGEVF
jgi:hypothetical protein